MLGLSPLHNLSRASKYELLGRPLRETIPFADTWKKGELVRPIKIPKSLRTEDIYLGDFGLAKKLDNPVTQRGYPSVHFCSPERLHNKDPSPACDMWAYMVIFSELYLGFLPFATFFEGGIITDYLKCFGPLPEEWKGLYIHPNGIDSWYDQRVQPDPKRSLASRITQFRPDADATELELVCSVMRKVFTYRPEERLTAAQLLQDKSFKALMKKYGC
jgi:serine/threonine protein kinase